MTRTWTEGARITSVSGSDRRTPLVDVGLEEVIDAKLSGGINVERVALANL